MKRFEDWVGTSSPATEISSSTVTAFYEYLDKEIAEGEISDWWARGCWATLKAFVKWLRGEEVIELPKNLDSRLYSFSVKKKEPKPVPDAVVKKLLDTASDRTRL